MRYIKRFESLNEKNFENIKFIDYIEYVENHRCLVFSEQELNDIEKMFGWSSEIQPLINTLSKDKLINYKINIEENRNSEIGPVIEIEFKTRVTQFTIWIIKTEDEYYFINPGKITKGALKCDQFDGLLEGLKYLITLI